MKQESKIVWNITMRVDEAGEIFERLVRADNGDEACELALKLVRAINRRYRPYVTETKQIGELDN